MVRVVSEVVLVAVLVDFKEVLLVVVLVDFKEVHLEVLEDHLEVQEEESR